MPTNSRLNREKVDARLRRVVADTKRLSNPSITVGERKRIAGELASLGALLASYSEELSKTASETEEDFGEELQREAVWKGMEITGVYPEYDLHYEGAGFSISVVEPYRLAFIDGIRIDRATPEVIVKRIIEAKSKRKPVILEDARHFSTVFSEACQLVSSTTGQSNVKLIHVLAVVRVAYQARKAAVNEIRLLEKSLSDGLVHLELHPGSDLRDAVPLRYEGIKRNVVWVKLVRE